MKARTVSDRIIVDRIESLRQSSAYSLRIDAERVRFSPEPCDRIEAFGQTGTIWQVHYCGRWVELPWHHESPDCVTRAMVRRWHDVEEPEEGKQ